jgi:hypothetical protein
MFPGFGFGVDVTVAELYPLVPAAVLPPGAVERRPRLHELLPADGFSDSELAREIQRAGQVESMAAAYKAERIAQLAARRPATADPGPGAPGATAERDERLGPEVSEFFPDELAVILNCSRTAATVLCDSASTLLQRLPATWAALADGELDWPRARAIAGELGWKARHTPPRVVAAVEAAVLPEASALSVSGVRAAVRRELLARDSLAADARRAQAQRSADVTVRPLPDGMGELRLLGPWPAITAIADTVDGYARLARDTGDPRPLGQLRVGVFTDLALRPWDTTRPPVTAHLTLIAPIPALSVTVSVGGQPRATGELNGEPITAGALRELLEDLDTCAPAVCRHRPAAACTSPSPSPAPAGCGPWSAAVNWNASPPAAAPPIPPATAGARCWKPRRRWTATAPPQRNAGSTPPVTAPADIPAAATGPSGPTSTTSFPTPRAAPPTAPTSAACADDTTG